MIVWLNGALTPTDEARIDPRDRGFLLGDGLFETLPAVSGQLFHLADHQARMARGAELLGLPIPPATAELEDAALTVLAANGLAHDHAALRITYTRGTGPRGLLPPDEPAPTLLISAAQSRPIAAPATAVVTAQRRNHLAPTSRIKCLGYLDNILARREADQAGANEGLMINGDGDLACASAANLFMVEAGVVLTPAVDHGALPGITREVALALAAANGIEAVEAAVSPKRLASATEAFLTNSLIGVRPLVAVNGVTFGDGTPGPLTRILEEAYVETLERFD
jgi:branched-chain amino acid aminotransferase